MPEVTPQRPTYKTQTAKGTLYAYTRVNGRKVTLGRAGTPAALAKLSRLQAEWDAAQHEFERAETTRLTVAEIAERFIQYESARQDAGLITNEHLQTTPVQVKTASGKNWQFNAENFIEIERDASDQSQTVTGLAPSEYPDLIHAFIWIDPEDRSNDRFFLLTLLQLQETIAKNYAAYLKRQGGSRPRNWESTHCSVKLEHLPAFEENWQLIGDRLQSAR